jgi:hypothetical protein
MKFQPQSSISLGSSGSHNSTFFKVDASNEVVYSISNMTEESGLLSALTRNEEVNEEKADMTTNACNDPETHEKMSSAEDMEKVNYYLSDTIAFRRGRSSTSRYTNNSESYAFDGNNSRDSATGQKVKNNSSSYEEFRAIFQKGTDCLKDKLTFSKGTSYYSCAETQAFMQKPREYYESAKEACNGRPYEGFKINLSNGIESLRSAANECGIWYATNQGCSNGAISTIENIQKLEMQLIDCIEPDSLKEDAKPIQDFGTLSPGTKQLIEKTTEGKHKQFGGHQHENRSSSSYVFPIHEKDNTRESPMNSDALSLQGSILIDPDNKIVEIPHVDNENESSAVDEHEVIEIDGIPSWIESDSQTSLGNEPNSNKLAPIETVDEEGLSDGHKSNLDSQIFAKEDKTQKPKSRFSPANKLRQLAVQRKKRALVRSMASRGRGSNWRKKIYEI